MECAPEDPPREAPIHARVNDSEAGFIVQGVITRHLERNTFMTSASSCNNFSDTITP